MSNEKKFVAIIPARSGSKGLKDKNIKDLNGKPLIAYTIEAAKNSGVFDDIIVSTDSEQYAMISKQYGATVPFLRPEQLATDQATSSDVIIYTLQELEKRGSKYDYFMLLQPTSPLRSADDIKKATELLLEKKADSIVSVCKSENSPLLMNTLDSTLSMDHFLEKNSNKRRQELPEYYRLNGAIYLNRVEHFYQYKDFYKTNSYAYIMNNKNSIDVDDIYDFKYAEIIQYNK